MKPSLSQKANAWPKRRRGGRLRARSHRQTRRPLRSRSSWRRRQRGVQGVEQRAGRREQRVVLGVQQPATRAPAPRRQPLRRPGCRRRRCSARAGPGASMAASCVQAEAACITTSKRDQVARGGVKRAASKSKPSADFEESLQVLEPDEARRGVDEALHQPGGGEPVDPGPLARRPGLALEIAGSPGVARAPRPARPGSPGDNLRSTSRAQRVQAPRPRARRAQGQGRNRSRACTDRRSVEAVNRLAQLPPRPPLLRCRWRTSFSALPRTRSRARARSNRRAKQSAPGRHRAPAASSMWAAAPP